MDRTYLVECYWPGVTAEAYADAVARARRAIRELRDEGRAVRLLDSLLMPADEAVFYRLASASLDNVEEVCRRAGLHADRIVEYVDAGGDGGEEPGDPGRP